MFPSVSETFISNKVRLLCKRGHHVTVFCSEKRTDLLNELFHDVPHLRVQLLGKKTIVKSWLYAPFSGLRHFRVHKSWLPQLYYAARTHLLNKADAEILHFEFSGIATDYLLSMDRLKGRKIVSCRGSAEKVKLLAYADRKIQFRQLMEKVDKVHCVSKDMAKTITPYCTNPKKIFINYPSIDILFFQRSQPYQLHEQITILSVGRLSFQKGYTNALFAMRFLKERRIPFQWIIAGSGDLEEEFVFKVHDLDLQEQVVLTGSLNRDAVKQYMEQADIFYLPSLYEGVANAVLEAMSMELPVVVTKCGGMEEVIEHGKDGLLADIFDFKEHARQFLQIIDNQEAAIEMGKKARMKVKEKFNLENQVTLFEKVYRAFDQA